MFRRRRVTAHSFALKMVSIASEWILPSPWPRRGNQLVLVRRKQRDITGSWKRTERPRMRAGSIARHPRTASRDH